MHQTVIDKTPGGRTSGTASRRRSSASTLAADLALLAERPYPDLKAEWQRLYRSLPPKKISRALLELGIAWRLQEKALGGLKPATQRQLAALARTLCAGEDLPTRRVITLKPGARLVREWNGATHDVVVLEDGFQWREKTWSSLSVIAREITGARWSGPRFFGIAPRGNTDMPNRAARPKAGARATRG